MIACLGWGSLIWKPGALPVGKTWASDGPRVKVEFLRQSSGNRMTLVMAEQGAIVPSLWTELHCETPAIAMEALAKREGTWRVSRPTNRIASWSVGEHDPDAIPGLSAWAIVHEVEHVIWTALGPRFRAVDGLVPTIDEVLALLRGLGGRERTDAEEYVRCAPPQIVTPYRQRIEQELGWTVKAA